MQIEIQAMYHIDILMEDGMKWDLPTREEDNA